MLTTIVKDLLVSIDTISTEAVGAFRVDMCIGKSLFTDWTLEFFPNEIMEEILGSIGIGIGISRCRSRHDGGWMAVLVVILIEGMLLKNVVCV